MIRRSLMERRHKANLIMSAPMFNAGPAHATALLDMAKQHRMIAHNARKTYERGSGWGNLTFHIHMRKAREYVRKVRQGGSP